MLSRIWLKRTDDHAPTRRECQAATGDAASFPSALRELRSRRLGRLGDRRRRRRLFRTGRRFRAGPLVDECEAAVGSPVDGS